MSDYKMKENTGSLFSNKENKKTDKHPDYKGKSMVNGKVMNMSAWINTAKSSGKQYISLKFDDFKPKNDPGYEYTTTTTEAVDFPE